MTPTVFGQDLKWPLIVYVQGSSWHKQKLFQSLPTLARMCERGYAIAIVEHRESELAPFPAQVIDVKTAIRFLRLNGQRYHIDTDKISLWGDSSGAHSALIAGITGDTKYLPEEYPEVSTEVDCIVDWFGPTDLMAAVQHPAVIDHDSSTSPAGILIGENHFMITRKMFIRPIPWFICSLTEKHLRFSLCTVAGIHWFRLISPAFYMRH